MCDILMSRPYPTRTRSFNHSSSTMLMSSPFAFAYRRRSHSASSQSPPPVPVSSWRPAHKRAHSSHRDTPTLPDSQPCHLDIWRSGKRARRDTSVGSLGLMHRPTDSAAPPQSPRATRSSTPASAHSSTSSSSAPHTPIFPASSADFLLFPSHPLYRGNPSTRNPHSPSSTVALLPDDMCEFPRSELTRLRSEAFSELQRSVEENGEGFVKRMREFEDSRSKSVHHSRPRGVERRRRKRHSPSVPIIRHTGKTMVSDDDDVLIFSSALGSEQSHARQRRSSSLGAMDVSDFQLHDASDSSGRLSPILSIFPSFPYPSHVHPSNPSQSTELSTSFRTSFDFTILPHTNAFRPTASYPSSESLASSTHMFPSSSYAEHADYPLSSSMASPPCSPCHPSAGAIQISSSTEKAIAALTLEMANGAGSLGDYEAVRALNVSSADESQAGELWH